MENCNSKKYKVLILLSTYNGDKYLKRQLESLPAQKGVEMYYLVRDDGSTDNTIKILEEFSRQELNVELILGNNVGCIKSFESLLIRAKDYLCRIDYFSFCDQDDFWLPDKLMVATNKLAENSKDCPQMYCSNLTLVNEKEAYIGLMKSGSVVKPSKSKSLVENIATGCTMVFNGKVIEFFNSYKPSYMTMHDLWVFHMCIFLGEVYYDNHSYILYRQHSTNVIGAKVNIVDILKAKINSIKTLANQHFREKQAKQLISVYGDILAKEDLELIKSLADYNQDFSSRVEFLFNSEILDIKMSSVIKNIFLKIRIILGKV